MRGENKIQNVYKFGVTIQISVGQEKFCTRKNHINLRGESRTILVYLLEQNKKYVQFDSKFCFLMKLIEKIGASPSDLRMVILFYLFFKVPSLFYIQDEGRKLGRPPTLDEKKL